MKIFRIIRWILILLFLVGAGFWIGDSWSIAQLERDYKIQLALQEMKTGIEQSAYCYDLHRQIEVTPGEELALIRLDTSGKADSIGNYIGVMGSHQRTFPNPQIEFESRARIRLNYRVEYLPGNPGQSSGEFQDWVDSSYQTYIVDSAHQFYLGDSSVIKEVVIQALVNQGLGPLPWYINNEKGEVLFSQGHPNLRASSVDSVELFNEAALWPIGRQTLNLTQGREGLWMAVWLRWELLVALSICGLVWLLLRSTERTLVREKRLNESQQAMLNHVSHEFNTQVAKIALSAESIQHHPKTDPSLSEYLDILRRSSLNLSQNLDAFLRSGNLNSQSYSKDKTPINIHHLIQEVVGEYAPRAEESDKAIKLESESESSSFRFNPIHFKQLLSNLVDNAIKYGGQEIRIRVRQSARFLSLTISDNGSGVSESQLSRLFDPYFRADSTGQQGFGIGLSYCKAVVKANSGHIWAENRSDGFFYIQVKLPAHE